MKRFIVDGMILLILVMIGSNVSQSKPISTIEEKIVHFEKEIARHEILYPVIDGAEVVEIKMNKASQLAKSSSQFIEDGVRLSVETLASIFKAIVE